MGRRNLVSVLATVAQLNALLAATPDAERRDYLTRTQGDGRTRLDRVLGGELDRVAAQICDETAGPYDMSWDGDWPSSRPRLRAGSRHLPEREMSSQAATAQAPASRFASWGMTTACSPAGRFRTAGATRHSRTSGSPCTGVWNACIPGRPRCPASLISGSAQAERCEDVHRSVAAGCPDT